MFLHFGFWLDCFHTCPLAPLAVTNSKMRVSGTNREKLTAFLKKQTKASLHLFVHIMFLLFLESNAG